MKIGIDFDNTLADYTGVFHRVAAEMGWIASAVPADKTSVRDHLRASGREDLWIELQGLVYGPHIFSAKPFPGAGIFLRGCATRGIEVFVISHKTRFPFLGASHDLHDYALRWLEKNGFFAPCGPVTRDNVFLELTKEEKLSRIAALGCDYFLDDLPEFLGDPGFPARVRRVLFDPHRFHDETPPNALRVRSWEEFGRLLP